MKFFIECTATYRSASNTGIQRVVRSIVKSSMNAAADNVAIPVIYQSGKFVGIKNKIPYPEVVGALEPHVLFSDQRKNRLKSAVRTGVAALAAAIPIPAFSRFLYAPRNTFGLAGIVFAPWSIVKRITNRHGPALHNPVTMERGDVLVLLDSSWDTNLWKTVAAYRRRGIYVAVVIYDLIPLTHPQFCTPGVVMAYRSWLGKAMVHADALMGISKTTASAIQIELANTVSAKAPLPCISYFWLGSELDGADTVGATIAPDVLALSITGIPTYVYVSTIEPRKNHRFALDGFEALWKSGVTANFVIVGKVGWHCAEFVTQVLAHPQFGKHLFMFNQVDDNALAYLYSTVQGLIFTSFAEGFGLPVIEGLQRGLPVFASDIPVFREIGQSGVQFVGLDDPDSLAGALAAHIQKGAPRLSQPVAWLNWHQSSCQLQQRIIACMTAGTTCAGTLIEESTPSTHHEAVLPDRVA